MLSEKQIEFTKENIDMYLKEVAKEYRKQIGKNMPAEMVLIGGASVLVNYGFRDMTAVPEKKEKPAKKTQPAKSKITYDELYNADIKTTEGQELAEALLESLERSEYTLGTVANNGYTFNIAMEGKKASGYIQDESGHVVFSTKQRNDQTHLSKKVVNFESQKAVSLELALWAEQNLQLGTSRVQFSLRGKTEDGIEVYETSEEVKALPWKERKKRFANLMENEYRGRTAKFTRNGHAYYATFEKDDINKNIYGDKKSDALGRDAKVNVGADGNIFELVENARYDKSSPEIGKPIKAHNNVNYWDYFVKTVQIDNQVFDVNINVRKKTDGSYVYSIQLNENPNIMPKAALPPINSNNEDLNGTPTASGINLPQTSPESKGNFSEREIIDEAVRIVKDLGLSDNFLEVRGKEALEIADKVFSKYEQLDNELDKLRGKIRTAIWKWPLQKKYDALLEEYRTLGPARFDIAALAISSSFTQEEFFKQIRDYALSGKNQSYRIGNDASSKYAGFVLPSGEILELPNADQVDHSSIREAFEAAVPKQVLRETSFVAVAISKGAVRFDDTFGGIEIPAFTRLSPDAHLTAEQYEAIKDRVVECQARGKQTFWYTAVDLFGSARPVRAFARYYFNGDISLEDTTPEAVAAKISRYYNARNGSAVLNTESKKKTEAELEAEREAERHHQAVSMFHYSEKDNATSRRLSESDLNDYLKVGVRQHVRNLKQKMAADGDKPILSNEGEIRNFILDSTKGKIIDTIKAYGRVNNKLASYVYNATEGSVDIADYYLELDSNSLKHLFGHTKDEYDEKGIPLTEKDVIEIPRYIDEFDDVIDVIRRKDGSLRLQLGKKINGYSIIIETVSKGRFSIQPKTAYKISAEWYNKYYKTKAVSNGFTSQSGYITNSQTAFADDNVSQDSAESKGKIQAAERDISAMAETAEKHFGTTKDYREAGYITVNGNYLDFSGKHWGGSTKGNRDVDHTDVAEILPSDFDTYAVTHDGKINRSGSMAMYEFQKYGNIRTQPETGSLELAVMPTKAQLEKVKKYVNDVRGSGKFDVVSVSFNDLTSKGKLYPAGYAKYDMSYSADAIALDIEDYYKNGRIPENGTSFGKSIQNSWMFSERDITKDDIRNIQSIGRKNVANFADNDIRKCGKFAAKFWDEMKEKSPFFRAWFGDWREYEQTPYSHVTFDKNLVFKAGKAINSDTNTIISWGDTVKRETYGHAKQKSVAAALLSNIEPIVQNAVLLSTSISTPYSSNSGSNKLSKMDNTAFMHSFYSIVDYGENVYLVKLFAEQALSNNGNNIFNRAYSLKDIAIVTTVPKGVLLNVNKEGLTHGGVTTIVNNISELFEFVKKNDKNFKYKPCDRDLLDSKGFPEIYENGNGQSYLTFLNDGNMDYTQEKSADNYGTFNRYENNPNYSERDNARSDRELLADALIRMDGINYFDTIFKVGGHYFQGVINIKVIKNGDLFTDITQTKEITEDISNSYGETPKFAFLDDSSGINLPQTSSEGKKKFSRCIHW